MNRWQEREEPVREFMFQLNQRNPEHLPRFDRMFPLGAFRRALLEQLETGKSNGALKWLHLEWGRDYLSWLAGDNPTISRDKLLKPHEKEEIAAILLIAADAIIEHVTEFRKTHSSTAKYPVAQFEKVAAAQDLPQYLATA